VVSYPIIRVQLRSDKVFFAFALGRLKDERAIEPVAERLEEFFDRHDAAEALQAIGPAAEKAVIKRLHHRDMRVREAAIEIIQVIGTSESIPALEKVVAENDFFLTDTAKEAIQTIKARTGK
jgi:HEAT repeat protein